MRKVGGAILLPQMPSCQHVAASQLFQLQSHRSRPASHSFQYAARVLRHWKLFYHSCCVDILKMAPTTTDIVLFFWTFLSLTPAACKNGLFALIFPTLDVLEQVLQYSLVTFAPGLWNVLRSKTPPAISYFKSLPLYTGIELRARFIV